MLIKERITKIIEKWYMIEPLFFAVWTSHHLCLNINLTSIRVGQGKIEYNPDFLENLNEKTLYHVLQFEVMRIILKHPYLRRKDIQTIAYMASNITLQEYLKTPLDFPYAKQIFKTNKYDKKYFEFYYQKLLNHQSSFPETSAIENTSLWEENEYYRNQINDTIEMALENNTWGTIPKHIQEQILATLKPKINYRQILKLFRANIISVKHVLTRMKPSRRYGFLYMGSRRDFSTKLLFAVDVSGSVSNDDLIKAFSIINQLFKYGIERVDVLQFDTEIRGKPLTLKKAKSKVKVIGRGGTNFQPVIDYIDKNKDYDGLIIFTDGWASIPTVPKNRQTRVLWLFNNEQNYKQMKKELKIIGQSTFIKE